MAPKVLWNIAKKRTLEEEDGDLLPEYQVMHEENFLSSWLREDVEDKEEEKEEAERGSQTRRKQKWEKDEGRK